MISLKMKCALIYVKATLDSEEMEISWEAPTYRRSHRLDSTIKLKDMSFQTLWIITTTTSRKWNHAKSHRVGLVANVEHFHIQRIAKNILNATHVVVIKSWHAPTKRHLMANAVQMNGLNAIISHVVHSTVNCWLIRGIMPAISFALKGKVYLINISCSVVTAQITTNSLESNSNAFAMLVLLLSNHHARRTAATTTNKFNLFYLFQFYSTIIIFQFKLNIK